MTRIDFYFNAENKSAVVERLILKSFDAGFNVLVYSCDHKVISSINNHLWTSSLYSFLPHVTCGNILAVRTPILIGSEPELLNRKDVMINLDHDISACFMEFNRLLEVVSTGAEDVENARARFRFYKNKGFALDSHDLKAVHEKKVGDIYGQIDALLGKRSPEILSERSNLNDDFPMLTEVISDPSVKVWDGAERRLNQANCQDRRSSERRANANVLEDGYRSGEKVINVVDIEQMLFIIEGKMLEIIENNKVKLVNTLMDNLREELNSIKNNHL